MLTTYIRDTQKHIFSVHNLGGVPLIYATVMPQFTEPKHEKRKYNLTLNPKKMNEKLIEAIEELAHEIKLLRNENQKLREVNEEISAKLYILNERISTLE